jgi:hypothetical protein
VALQTGTFQGFSRFRYVRLRKRAVLKSRIIDSHAVVRVALLATRPGELPASYGRLCDTRSDCGATRPQGITG